MDFHTPDQDRDSLDQPRVRAQGIPNVLLIGDSISGGYTEPVQQMLSDVCNVTRPNANCGDTKRGLAELEAWLGPDDWDLIHFNWGLHDLCYRHPDAKVYGNRDKINGTISVELNEYRENLDTLVKQLKRRAKLLIWASTTFVPDREAGRYQGDDVRYNEVAAEVMRGHDVPINGLHEISASLPAEMFTCPGDVHYTKEGSHRLGEAVAASIRKQLTLHGLI